MPKEPREQQQIDPLAAALAWVVPGLGHMFIGDIRRGVLLLVAIHLMMLTGLLIGGIDVVDRKDDRWWYLGQMLAGPIPVLVDRYHQSQKVVIRNGRTTKLAPPPPGEDVPFEPSLARVNELGTLFVTLAGMLNLMCIIDVVQHPKRERRHAAGVVGSVEARER
ncbi:MAG: hypothetical protein KAS72_12750 [Phycisphaerales bacterium]|nr:hypothetical protein [Phycisphaerales bacterium]